MKTLTEKRFFEWHEDDVSVTIRNKSGSYCGGSEVLVIEGVIDVEKLERKSDIYNIDNKKRWGVAEDAR